MKIEMHVHTSEVSPCSHVPAKEMVALYKKSGYDCVVITDHYNKWVMEQSGCTQHLDFARHFLSGYERAKEEAKQYGLLVLPGVEVNLTESPNDYLLYGIEPQFILNHPDLFLLSLKELSALCHRENVLLFQAHPNRSYCSPAPASLLDGAEIFNGNPRHANNNEKTVTWTRENHLLVSSGSDFHEIEDLAKGGIETPENVTTIKQLCQVLKSGNFTLITP